ncbi:DMT family transporter [Gordonia sp. NB41Y]|uniref:DMT family transporter n=1 Tax=Gordonia sp. NB41Y TaxID=875808 RepID=UPI0006B1C59A|nr:DMT family transporter [Gordonia sp. NB41Y]WLP88521.1 DMT family transporter [Gordonia sp. NB41Y]
MVGRTAERGLTGSSPTGGGAAWAAPLVLVAVAAAWGLSIGLSKELVDRLPVADYLAVRYTIGVAILIALCPRAVMGIRGPELRHGVVLGLLFGLAQYIQFEGLSRASIVVASFLVSLYVVFTPMLLAIARRRRPSRVTVIAAAVSLAGVASMAVRGWSFGIGEALTVLSALIYALHVIWVARWATAGKAIAISVVQLAVLSLVFTVAALPGGFSLPTGPDWPAMMYLATIAGVAIVAQVWAQTRMSAESAAIIMVLEPVWASVFAVVLWSESPDLRTIVGGALVVAASVLVVVASARVRPGDRTSRETLSCS